VAELTKQGMTATQIAENMSITAETVVRNCRRARGPGELSA
jgi:DNA-binding CsgD family transcriptional regulator